MNNYIIITILYSIFQVVNDTCVSFDSNCSNHTCCEPYVCYEQTVCIGMDNLTKNITI